MYTEHRNGRPALHLLTPTRIPDPEPPAPVTPPHAAPPPSTPPKRTPPMAEWKLFLFTVGAFGLAAGIVFYGIYALLTSFPAWVNEVGGWLDAFAGGLLP